MRFPLPIVLSYALLMAGCSAPKHDEFETTDFDQGWRFTKGDVPKAQYPGFDDSGWTLLDLPHDWSIEGPFDRNNPAYSRGAWLPAGMCYYRKTFSLPAWTKEKKVLIYFGGVYRNSEVWINGDYLGRRPSGYSSFYYDLTPHLTYPGANVITVKADNSAQPGSRWYSGTGIYRDVRLLVRDQLSIPIWGTAVTTPVAEAGRAEVAIASTIANDYPSPQTFTFGASLLDADGRTVARAANRVSLAARASGVFRLTLDVKNPMRWGPDTPYLYTVRTTLELNGRLLHADNIPTGIRKLEYDAARGFILNGEVTRIKGVCLHHDGGPLGAAVFPQTLARQFSIMKKMGANAIRTTHNPMSDDFLNLCDRMGMLVLDEAFDEWEIPKTVPDFDEQGQRVTHRMRYYAADFDEWADRDLADFVLRDRNHPSVFMWGIGNEIAQTEDRSGIAIARRLNAVVHTYDSRPTTMACNGFHGLENPNLAELAANIDVYGFNYPQTEQIAHDHRQWPDRKMIVTECSSAQPKIQRGEYDLRPDLAGHKSGADGSITDKGLPQYLAFTLGIMEWQAVLDNPNVMGMFIWTGMDYLGEVNPHPWPAHSSFYAPVDIGGFPKDGYYYYQSQWSERPMVHLFPHWNWEGKDGDLIPVGCFSNCATVELSLNGRPVGKKPVNPKEVTIFQVPYEKGELKAVGYSAEGKRMAETTIVTAGAAAKIVLSTRTPQLKADGRDLLYVECSVTDRAGNLVPAADNTLQFRVEGPASIAGVENGDQLDQGSFKADHRKAFRGRCLAIIKSSTRAGLVTFSASSAGLETAKTTIGIH